MGKQVNAVAWSSNDKKMLLDLYNEHAGNRHKWRLMSKHFQRTNASVRNCFRRINPTRLHHLRAQYARAANTCTKCGELKRGHVCEQDLGEYETVKVQLMGSDLTNSDKQTQRASSQPSSHSHSVDSSIIQGSPPLSPTCSVRSVNFEELDHLCNDMY